MQIKLKRIGCFALAKLMLTAMAAVPLEAQTMPSGAIQRIERDKQLRDGLNRINNNGRDRDPVNVTPSFEETSPSHTTRDQTVSIQRFELEGASVESLTSNIQERAQSLIGRSTTLQEIEELRQWIRHEYHENHLLALVRVKADLLAQGVLAIAITEARLGEIKIDPTVAHKLKDDRAISMVASANQPGSLLRTDKLTSALLKLNDMAGVQVKSRLQKGDKPGETNVLLVVSDGNRNTGFGQINNETSRYLGDVETELILTTANNAGLGEEFILDGQWWGNTQGTGNIFGAATLNLPLSSDGLQASFYGNTSKYRLLQEFYDDNINGNSSSFKLSLKQPLWRRPRNSLWVELSANYNIYIDRIDDVETRHRNSKVGRLSLIGQHQDDLAGTGLNTVLAQVSYGNLDRSGNDFDYALDELTSETHGDFSKVSLLYNRYQVFSPRWQAKLLMQGQAGFNNLDGAEKISIGYPNGVRAYPPGEGAGDSGISGQAELIYRASPLISLSTFIDGGYVWRWNSPFQGSLEPNDYGLAGAGVGINIGTNGEWLISTTLAVPIGDNPATPDGRDVDGYDNSIRLWSSFKIWF